MYLFLSLDPSMADVDGLTWNLFISDESGPEFQRTQFLPNPRMAGSLITRANSSLSCLTGSVFDSQDSTTLRDEGLAESNVRLFEIR